MFPADFFSIRMPYVTTPYGFSLVNFIQIDTKKEIFIAGSD